MIDVHPESRLGRLQAALHAAETAHQTATADLVTHQTEAGEIDRWIEVAPLHTAGLEVAEKQGRRTLLANAMARTRLEIETYAATGTQLRVQLQPLEDHYHAVRTRLPALQARTADWVRQMSLYAIDQMIESNQAWLKEWTHEAPAVDALEPVEA